MEARNKMKFILDDIYDLERQLRDYKDIKEKLDKRNNDLDVAIEEYQQSTEPEVIKLYAKVKVIKNSEVNAMEDFEVYEGEVGVIVDIDSDYKYPYSIQFENGVVNKYANDNGGPLWERGQLELI